MAVTVPAVTMVMVAVPVVAFAVAPVLPLMSVTPLLAVVVGTVADRGAAHIPVGCLVAGLVLRYAFAKARTGRTTGASTQDGTGSPAHRLTDGGACCTTHGTPDDGATLTRAAGADRRPGGATDGPTNNCAVAPTDRLPKHRPGRCARTTPEDGADVVGLRRMHHGHQSHGRQQGAKERVGNCGSVKSLHVRGVGHMPVPLNVAAYAPLTARRRAG